jgi:hypothetical protein
MMSDEYKKYYLEPVGSAIPRDDIPVDYRVRYLDRKIQMLIKTLMFIHGGEFTENWNKVRQKLEDNGNFWMD